MADAHSLGSVQLLRGYRLAVSRINDRGGVVIGNRRHLVELIVLDDKGDDSTALAAAEKMAAQGVTALLGPYDPNLAAKVADMAERRGVPMVQAASVASSMFRDRGRRFVFGISATTDQYLNGGLDLAVEAVARCRIAPGDVRWGMAMVRDSVGEERREAILAHARELGMPAPVFDEALAEPTENFSSVLTQIDRHRPALLLVSGYSRAAEVAVSQMAQSGTRMPMMVVTHCEAARIERMGRQGNYVLCPSQWNPYAGYSDRWFGSAVSFMIDYELAYDGESPAYEAAEGAAAVIVLADAIERAARADRNAIRTALSATDLMTLFGRVRFDDSGRNTARSMILTQLQGGRYSIVWPYDIAWARAILPAPRWQDRAGTASKAENVDSKGPQCAFQ